MKLRNAAVVIATLPIPFAAAADPSVAALAAPGDCAQASAAFEMPPLYDQPAGVAGPAAEHFAPRNDGGDGLAGLLPVDVTRPRTTLIGVATGTVDGVTQVATDGVSGVVGGAGAAVEGTTGAVGDTVSGLGDAVSGVGETVSGLGGTLDSAGGAIDGLGGAIGDAGGGLGEGLAGTGGTLGEVTGTVDALTDTVTGTLGLGGR